MSCPVAESPKLAVFVKGWPRLSETFIAQELLALQERGVPFVIVSLRRPTDSKRHPLHEAVTAPVLYLPEYLRREPLRFLGALLRVGCGRMPRSLKREPWRRWGQSIVASAELPRTVQGIYAHFLHSPSTVAQQVAAMRGVPWAASAHAKDIYTSEPDALRVKLSSAAWVTTCTAANAAYLKNLAAEPQRITLSYHGLDTARFPLAVSAPGAGGLVRLLAVGRLVAKKGFDDLLEALALLPEKCDWRLEHIGGGDAGALKAQAERLGLSTRIVWRGAQAAPEVLEAYRRADIFVLPSKIAGDGDRDGLPNVLLEAGSQGLAVVATTVSAIPELIESGVHGRLVPPGDAPALAAVLTELAYNRSLRHHLGQALQQRVAADFSAAVQLAPLLDKLEALSWGRSA